MILMSPHGFLSLVLSSCELDPSYKEFLCQSCSLSCWAFIDCFMSTDNVSAFVPAVKWKLMGAFRRFFRPTAISTRVFLASNGVDHMLDRFLVATGSTRRIKCLYTLESFYQTRWRVSCWRETHFLQYLHSLLCDGILYHRSAVELVNFFNKVSENWNNSQYGFPSLASRPQNDFCSCWVGGSLEKTPMTNCHCPKPQYIKFLPKPQNLIPQTPKTWISGTSRPSSHLVHKFY